MKYYVIVCKRDEEMIGWVTDKAMKKDGLTIYKLTTEKFKAKMWVSEKVAEKTLIKLITSGLYGGKLSIEEVGVSVSES